MTRGWFGGQRPRWLYWFPLLAALALLAGMRPALVDAVRDSAGDGCTRNVRLASPPPCNTDAYEQSLDGGCWLEVGVAPCRSESVERFGKCYLAAIATSPPPLQSEDREAH